MKRRSELFVGVLDSTHYLTFRVQLDTSSHDYQKHTSKSIYKIKAYERDSRLRTARYELSVCYQYSYLFSLQTGREYKANWYLLHNIKKYVIGV